jgi:transcriptional regulator with XRE-family HTH domain
VEAGEAGVEAGTWLRAARREAGLSQRGLAERAGVSRRLVEDAESGRCSPRYDVLVRLLGSCGQELVLRPRPAAQPPNEERLVAWLRLSVGERLARTCGEPLARAAAGPWRELVRLGSLGPLSAVDGPLAYGAWLPGQELVAGQRLRGHGWSADAAAPLILARAESPPERSLVRVPLPRHGGLRSCLLVRTPESLLAGAPPHLREPLARAAQLLHDDGPRDGAGRRPPAHREVDLYRDLRRWEKRYQAAAPGPMDARAWRLGGAGSFNELARRHGAQPWPRKPGWTRWGWR